ncbi:Gfo/Idh/MocA family oxidoreductase [Candidatus Aerophobetes bacterium]|nr:Gfo/Idh/MocA family oxidoreductase [Candidatus Aerophobetes bacterium]
MQRKIKVGVIGAGFIGPAHIESLRRLGFVEVVALATSREETAKAKAKALSIPKAYGHYQDLVQDEEVEVVQITSPNYLHFSQIKAALEAGKHVVCDKPLTITSQESRTLVEIAEKKGLVNAVTFNHRFYPLVQQSRALIQKGELGSLYFIHGGFHQDWLLYDTDYNWRVEKDKGGAVRAIGDIGTHWFDTVQFVTGLKVEAVFAELATFIPFRKKPRERIETFAGKELRPVDFEKVTVDTEDCGIVLLKFAGVSTRGVMTVSQISAGRKCRLFYEVSGERASISWDSEKANQLWIGYRDKPNEILLKDPALMDLSAKRFARYPGGHLEGFPDSHTQCNRVIYEYIREERYKKGIPPEFPTFKTGHEEQLLCEAILESHQRGEWVKVDYSR